MVSFVCSESCFYTLSLPFDHQSILMKGHLMGTPHIRLYFRLYLVFLIIGYNKLVQRACTSVRDSSESDSRPISGSI